MEKSNSKKEVLRQSFIRMTLLVAIGAMISLCVFNKAAYAADEIRLGAITSLSGHASPLGHELGNAIKLAVEKVNQKGGVLGRPIKLFMEDDESKKPSGLSKARKLVERDGVHFLVGVIDTTVCLAIQHFAKEKKIIFINTGSGADILVRPPNCSRYFFKVAPTTSMGATAVSYPEQKFGKDWVFLALDYAWGRGVVEFSKSILAKKNKVRVLKEIYFPFSETNYAPYLTPYVLKQPDVIAIAVFGAHYPRLIRQIRQMGIKSHIHCYFHSRPSVLAAGDAALGMTSMNTYLINNPKVPKANLFAKEFYKKYKTYPGLHGANAFTAVEVLMEAVEKAGSLKTDAVINVLETKQFKNTVLAPNFRFRYSDHQAIYPVFVGKIVKDPELKYAYQLEHTVDDPTELLAPEDQTGCPVP
jgi:branched-chain amino acid transport system substrate-binding protein